jgi:hypothetical protein
MNEPIALIDEVLSLLGYEEPVNLTAQLTGAPISLSAKSASKERCVDRVDRVAHGFVGESRVNERPRFEIGKRYRRMTPEALHPLTTGQREELSKAGFPRAGIVCVAGDVLLIDDVARLMVDGVMMVLGYAEFDQPGDTQRTGLGRNR